MLKLSEGAEAREPAQAYSQQQELRVFLALLSRQFFSPQTAENKFS